MSKLKTATPGEYQEAIRVIVPEIPGFPAPEWARTLIVKQSGEAMIPAGLVDMESQLFLDKSEEEIIDWVMFQDRLYFPLRWVAAKRPQLAWLWSLLEEKVRSTLEDEVDRRGV